LKDILDIPKDEEDLPAGAIHIKGQNLSGVNNNLVVSEGAINFGVDVLVNTLIDRTSGDKYDDVIGRLNNQKKVAASTATNNWLRKVYDTELPRFAQTVWGNYTTEQQRKAGGSYSAFLKKVTTNFNNKLGSNPKISDIRDLIISMESVICWLVEPKTTEETNPKQ